MRSARPLLPLGASFYWGASFLGASCRPFSLFSFTLRIAGSLGQGLDVRLEGAQIGGGSGARRALRARRAPDPPPIWPAVGYWGWALRHGGLCSAMQCSLPCDGSDWFSPRAGSFTRLARFRCLLPGSFSGQRGGGFLGYSSTWKVFRKSCQIGRVGSSLWPSFSSMAPVICKVSGVSFPNSSA